MTDEIALTKATEQAARAANLLNDEMLQGAFKGLKDQYSQDLLATTVDQVGARERLYLAYRVVNEVERHLMNWVTNGKVAARELKDLAETAERQKSWHQI